MSGTTPPASTVGVNPNVPAITQPLANVEALTRVLLQVRQGVQSLAGQIGSTSDRAVTFNDLKPVLDRITKLEQDFAALSPP